MPALPYCGPVNTKVVYGVHAVRPDEICATHLITSTLQAAEAEAVALSNDPGVLASVVTRFELDVLGIRTPVAMFVKGLRQQVGHCSDDRTIFAGGWSNRRRIRP